MTQMKIVLHLRSICVNLRIAPAKPSRRAADLPRCDETFQRHIGSWGVARCAHSRGAIEAWALASKLSRNA